MVFNELIGATEGRRYKPCTDNTTEASISCECAGTMIVWNKLFAVLILICNIKALGYVQTSYCTQWLYDML